MSHHLDNIKLATFYYFIFHLSKCFIKTELKAKEFHNFDADNCCFIYISYSFYIQ
jgi:hypothetical protein